MVFDYVVRLRNIVKDSDSPFVQHFSVNGKNSLMKVKVFGGITVCKLRAHGGEAG